MDLEARSLPPTEKAMLLAKLREYKSDLTNLKRDVKKSASTDAAAARDDLLETGRGDYVNVSTETLAFLKCMHTITICTHTVKFDARYLTYPLSVVCIYFFF